jgi:hypothetical protein
MGENNSREFPLLRCHHFSFDPVKRKNALTETQIVTFQTREGDRRG